MKTWRRGKWIDLAQTDNSGVLARKAIEEQYGPCPGAQTDDGQVINAGTDGRINYIMFCGKKFVPEEEGEDTDVGHDRGRQTEEVAAPVDGLVDRAVNILAPTEGDTDGPETYGPAENVLDKDGADSCDSDSGVSAHRDHNPTEVAEDELEGLLDKEMQPILDAVERRNYTEVEHRIRTLLTKQREEQRHEGIVIGHAEAQVDVESLREQLAAEVKRREMCNTHAVLMEDRAGAAESEVTALKERLAEAMEALSDVLPFAEYEKRQIYQGMVDEWEAIPDAEKEAHCNASKS